MLAVVNHSICGNVSVFEPLEPCSQGLAVFGDEISYTSGFCLPLHHNHTLSTGKTPDNMADPDVEYLSPAFDPASLTVPRLRSILVEHDVRYPSSAKKADLIDIFTQNITPKAKRILSAHRRVKRSARGIEDVPSSVEPSVESDESDLEEETKVASPPPTVRKTPRRVLQANTITSMDGAADLDPPTVRRVGRPTTVRQGRSSDVEVMQERATPRSPSGRTRQSLATPAIKKEDDQDVPTAPRDDVASPFSANNPFQSGSSPSTGVALAVSGERRRRTLGVPQSRSEPARTSSRRKTEGPTSQRRVNGSATTPPSKTEQALVGNKRTQEESSGTEDAGEEFTPEGAEEVAEARAQHGEVARRPLKRRKSSRSTSGVAKVAPWAVSLAMLGGLTTVWRQEKIEVGFCGVGRPSTSLAGVHIPEWANVLQPECEPCPPHAYCYSGMQVSCEPDFILVPHPLSIGGLVPLPPTCEPDGDKARKVKAVADRAVEELRERNAKWECGDLKEVAGKRHAVPEMKEPELKQAVASKKRKTMSQEEFEELWQAAIGEISNRDEIEVGVDG